MDANSPFSLAVLANQRAKSSEAGGFMILAQCSGFPSLHPHCYKKAKADSSQTSPVLPKTYKMFLDSKKAEFNAAR